MMNLKQKTIHGVFWNATGKFTAMGIEFIVGIILARLLSPAEFGLVGTITVVIVLSEIFVNSGFSQAIIRKQNCTQTDFSTAFFFNLLIGFLFFLLLLFTAKPISIFFKNEDLEPLIQVLGVGLIISSLTLIQHTKLSKRIDFKLQTKISVIASVLSGVIAIALAITGFGVWSLVVKSLTNKALISIMLWYWNKWRPDIIFSRESFNELFGFGSKLLLSGLMTTFFQNINYLIIAKYFTFQDLGYFTRAELFKNLPSQNVSGIVTAVGYPVLATLQDDPVRMKSVFREMLTKTFFIIAVLMAGMAATAKALILTLVGEQWLPSVVLLQMLCFVGIMQPLNSMNINILNVVGRSDLYLKLQLIVQILAVPNIFIGVFFGIKALIGGMIMISLFAYVIFNHESNKVLNYPIKEQIYDVYPSLILSFSMGIVVYLVGYLSNINHLITLILQIITGITIVVIFAELLRIKEYLFLKNTIMDKYQVIFTR